MMNLIGNWVTKNTAEEITAEKDFSGGIKADTISESTAGAGVTVDGVQFKDSEIIQTRAVNDYFSNTMQNSTNGASSVVRKIIKNSSNIALYLKVFSGGHSTTALQNFAEILHDYSMRIGCNNDNSLFLSVNDRDIVEVDSSGLKVDTLSEKTTDAGMTAEGVKLKDGTIETSSLIRKASSESVADDATIILPTGVAGRGWAMAGDNEEYMEFTFTSAGVVTMLIYSANAINTDTDANLCVYDAGSGIAIKNRLGSSKTIRYEIKYS